MTNNNDSKVTFLRWPEIHQLHNLVFSIQKSKKQFDETGKAIEPFDITFNNDIIYRGKVKLHGSNAAVTLEKNGMRVQTRSQFTDKNSGLGRMIYSAEDYFRSLFDEKGNYKKLTVFGEWCGPKVQKGVALSMLKSDIFVVFAVQIDNVIVIEPESILKIVTKDGTVSLPKFMHVLPWHTDKFPLRFLDEKQLNSEVEKLNQLVQQIDNEDPWVLKTFNIKGPGEGLVLYPVSLVDKDGHLAADLFPEFVFKAKGEKHRMVKSTKTKKTVTITPEVAANAKKYAEMMLTEARLQQGVKEVGGVDKKLMSKFVMWMKNDVQKEGKHELEVSNLKWEQVDKTVASMAIEWYKKQLAEKK